MRPFLRKAEGAAWVAGGAADSAEGLAAAGAADWAEMAERVLKSPFPAIPSGCFRRKPGAGAGGAGREDGVRHAVDDLLVGRADRGQHAAEFGAGRVAVAGDKVVRAQPHAAFHRHELPRSKSNQCASTSAACGSAATRAASVETGNAGPPPPTIRLRQIAAEKNAARAPGVVGEAGDFQNQVALLLRKRLELLPVGQVQFGNRGVRRQRCRINDPGVGNELVQPA